jgi:hypothetical protein
MRSQLLWDVTQGLVVLTDVSRQPIVPSSRIEQKHSNHCTGIFQALDFKGFEALRFLYSQHKRVAKLSAVGAGHLYPKEIFLVPICIGD